MKKNNISKFTPFKMLELQLILNSSLRKMIMDGFIKYYPIHT